MERNLRLPSFFQNAINRVAKPCPSGLSHFRKFLLVQTLILTGVESKGLVGLYNRPGRGRKATFNQEQIKQIKEQCNTTVSTKTIKRILHKVRMSWHRLRRGVGGQPKTSEYIAKKSQLEQLKQLDETGIIELYYLDETGFCLSPCVPYGWQPIGKYKAIALLS